MKRLIPLLILAITAVCYAQQRGTDTLGAGPWTYTTSERGTKVKVSVVAKGLSHPWSMVWLPNGDMLITERSGQLRILRNGVLDPAPIAGVPKVQAGGTSGLLDIARQTENLLTEATTVKVDAGSGAKVATEHLIPIYERRLRRAQVGARWPIGVRESLISYILGF